MGAERGAALYAGPGSLPLAPGTDTLSETTVVNMASPYFSDWTLN